MPATVSSAASRADVKLSSAKLRSSPQPRKTRMVKRRGRGRDQFDSDDEFVREVGTDSESDDARSSVASETDSDTEPISEDIVSNGHSHFLTPNTTQSSADVPKLNHQSAKDLQGNSTSSLSAAGDWSEMVAEETANGPAELPVIEFAEFNSPSVPQRTLSGPPPRKTGKASKRPLFKRAVSAPSSDRGTAPQLAPVQVHEVAEPVDDQPRASTSRQPSRNHAARHAYQQRLEADPSYVPTVGEFWGHDDRLLDKDLRSLSGWWRGRWQGRGRGRGGFSGGFGRGRGRGGFTDSESSRPAPETPVSQETEKPPAVTPSIDQLWTHDGFEEMKKRDEKRRVAVQSQQQQAARPARGFMPLRGRGAFIAGRGRGGFTRGGFAPSPTRAHFAPPAAAAAASGRTWYAMKPERVWTKQHEGFLHFDHALRTRPGQGPGYRVKLGGKEGHVVRGPVRAPQATSEHAQAAPGEKTFVVRLPKRAGKEKASEPVVEAVEANITVANAPVEDVFTVRPELVPPRQPIPTSQSASPAVNGHVASASVSAAPSKSAAPAPSSPHVSTSPKEKITSPLLNQMMREAADQQAKETADVTNAILQEQYDQNAPALLQVEPPAVNLDTSDAVRQSIPPLQTVFSPPSQPSPPYGSPFGYGSSLPPGVAIGHHGMAYEIATGRPVYLQHPTMYTPRPLAHGMMTPPGLPYPPMHHHSNGSPDFLAPSHTPPINGFIDPNTGNPLFAFPRQSSRIEIRSPSSHSDLKPSKSSNRRPSSLRMSAASFEPSRPASPNTESQPYRSSEGHSAQDDASSSQATDQPTPEQSMENAMYGYSPYQQQYYYPDHYGYSQYYDMSQVPQYEMYPTDPHAAQAVYY